MRLRAGRAELRQGCGADGRPGDRHRAGRRGQRADPGARRLAPTAPARSSVPRRRAGAQFSLVLTKNTAVQKAIDAIPEDAWTPVRYPGAVQDPDTGVWISDAEVAEISYTAFASTNDAITARLIVRRVKDARHRDALFPVWRYHPFFTNSRRAARRRRHHPPPPRHHRNHLRRPDRRPAGTHALRALRRQLGLGAVRCHRPQPAARRGNPGRWPPRRRTRSHPAPQDRQHPRPPGPPTTATRPAPTQPLALGGCMACTVAQHHRATHRHCPPQPDHPPKGPTGEHRKAGQTSGYLTPTTCPPINTRSTRSNPAPVS